VSGAGNLLRVVGAAILAWMQITDGWGQDTPMIMPAPPAPPSIASPPVIRLPLAEGQKVSFRLAWRVIPQPGNDAVLQLREGQTVTSARLVPIAMWQLVDELKSTDGKTVLPSGTQLVRGASAVPIACSIRSLKVGVVEGILFNSERYVCATDEDRDGKLDHFFFRGESNRGMVAGLERIPERVYAAATGTIQVADPLGAVDAPTIELQYTNYAFLSKWILFQLCVRPAGGPCNLLADNLGLRRRELPGTFDALGGDFEILEKNEAGIRVRMVRPFRSTTMTFGS